MEFVEETLNSKLVFDGKLINVFSDDVQISNGHKTFREVVKHPGGVVVLAVKNPHTSPGRGGNSSNNSLTSPYLQPSILFVRQFRYPMKEILLELPAGKLEYGEDPFEAGKRELEEETGYCANKWTDLGYVYTSPGYSNEKLYLYLAEDLEYKKCKPDEGEILEPLELSYEDALDMIKTGKIVDAKTLCAFMKVRLIFSS